MDSNFYIVHHEFRAGTSSKWWGNTYAAMASGRGWDESVAANKEKKRGQLFSQCCYCKWSYLLYLGNKRRYFYRRISGIH